MIYTYVATGIAAALLAGVGTWKVQDWRYASLEKDRLEQQAKERGIRIQRGDTAATGHEKDKAEIITEFREITKEVERVVEKPVYRDVCLDDDGLRVLGHAIRGSDATGKPAGAVPGPDRSK